MRFVTMFWLAVFCAHSYANVLTSSEPIFQPKAANQTLDQIGIQLSIQNLDIKNLNHAVVTLTELMSGAEDCISNAKDKLDSIDTMLKQGHDVKNSNSPSVDFVYLSNEQKKAQDRQAQCRLFFIRAKEAVTAYKKAIATIKQQQALQKSYPLWTLVTSVIHLPAETPWYDLSTLDVPPMIDSFWNWGLLLLSTLVCSSFLIVRVFKTRFARRYLKPAKTRFSYISLASGCLIALILFAYFWIYSENLNAPILAPIRPLLVYFIALLSTLFIFRLKRFKSLFSWFKLDINFFKTLTLWLISLYQLKNISSNIAIAIKINPLIIQLNQVIYCFILIGLGIYLLHRFIKTHMMLHLVKKYQRLLKCSVSLALLACFVLEAFGYHMLTLQIMNAGFLTLTTLFVMLLALKATTNVHVLLYSQDQVKTFIMRQFGYEKNQTFVEFLILKCILQIIVIALSLVYLDNAWQFVTNDSNDFSALLLNGFHIAKLTVYPARLLTGLVVFSILYLLFRFLTQQLNGHKQVNAEHKIEEIKQVAIVSILNYIGFALSIIVALLVAGFDFTALAIVAGALSVGIGLGLQSIVNNFVSGLILLIEKPIKPGDRIFIDGTEGCVKKISVRSTLIVTALKEDIIIPNSDLITKKVVNYTYQDRYLSILCDVPVSRDSDTQLVKALLLQVASSHADVINSTKNKPYVFFSSINEKSLLFQLSCLIKDAHNKSAIHSELNFAIYQQLKEHNIQFA